MQYYLLCRNGSLIELPSMVETPSISFALPLVSVIKLFINLILREYL